MDEFTDYLSSLRDRYPETQLEAIFHAVVYLQVLTGVRKLPAVGPMDDVFLLTWDCDKEVFDIEVDSAGRFEWFYRNRATDQVDGVEAFEEGLSVALVARAFQVLSRAAVQPAKMAP